MAGLNLDAELVDKRKSPISLEEALAKQTDPMKLVSGLQRYHEAVDAGEMPFTPEVGNMVKSRLEALAGGVKRVGSVIADSFDPGPAPEDMGLNGSYRDPLNTATGGRMNPITAAGYAILSAGEGMQGKPLSILDMQKTGVAREREIAQAQSAKQTNALHVRTAAIAANKEGREQNKQYFEQANGMLKGLEDAEKTGDPAAFTPLYMRFRDSVIKGGGTPEEAAAMFRTARENTSQMREMLNDSFGHAIAEVLPAEDVRALYAGMAKDPKNLHNFRLGLAIRANKIAKAKNLPQVVSDDDMDTLRKMSGQPTSAASREEVAKANKAELDADEAVMTENSRIDRARAEADTAQEKTLLTREERKLTTARAEKLEDEIAANVGDKEVSKLVKAGLERMSEGADIDSLPQVLQMAVKKALRDPRTVDQAMALKEEQLKLSGQVYQSKIVGMLYAVESQGGGDGATKRALLESLYKLAGIPVTMTETVGERIQKILGIGSPGASIPTPAGTVKPVVRPGKKTSDIDMNKLKEDIKGIGKKKE